MKALIVDRDPESLAFAAEALHSFAPGFDVATARDARQAGEWLQSFRPRLLIIETGLADEVSSLIGRLPSLAGSPGCEVWLLAEEPGTSWAALKARLGASAVLSRRPRLQELLDAARGLAKEPALRVCRPAV
jgi:DNA-binding response OmpR family regulator